MSSTTPSQNIDLTQLFGVAAQALAANQQALNTADVAQGNHGDHMVKTFQLITNALASTQGKPPAEQLAYASKKLNAHAKVSGSAQVYSKGLAQASRQMRGQQAVTPDMAMMLVQTLLGGGQAPAPQPRPSAGGADLLSQLLGSGGQPAPMSQPSAGADLLGQLLGGGQTAPTQQTPAGADLLGQLLGGVPQQQQQQPSGGSQSGLDMGDLLTAGLAFMQAKQQGQDNLQAAVSALMAASPLNQKPYRQQSGELVATALLQAISAFAKK